MSGREDEVDLGENQGGEDYEVVPMGPIRKLERRMTDIESQATEGGADEEVIRDVLDIMKSNQKIVNDMTESTHQLKNSVEDLTHKMDEVVGNMNSFMELLREASEMDMEGEVVSDIQGQLTESLGNQMEEAMSGLQEQNKEIVESLDQLNDTMRKNYAAQNKDEIMDRASGQGRTNRSSQNSRRNRQSSEGQRRGNSSQSQQGNRQQNQRRQSSRDSDSNERMRKLRKRFENQNEQ